MKTITPTVNAAPERQAPAASRPALASLALAVLLSSLGTSIANVALPTLTQAFDASFQSVQWIVLAYLLAITTLVVSVGRLGDLIGRRRLLLAGIALFSAASLAAGAAPTLALLIAARALQGVGAAIMMALTMALVGQTVSKARTGAAIGMLGTMSAVGTALGPVLGGLLIAGFGWRAIFLIKLPLGLLTWLLAYRYLPDERPPAASARTGFDYPGTLLLALTLAAYALATTVGRGHFGAANLALFLLAGVGAAAFVRVEARSPAPLISLALLRQPALSAGLAMGALVSTVMMATLVVGPFYLARALALDATAVGLALSVGPLVAALTAAPAGRLADSLGAPRMVSAGLLAIAAGTVTLAVLPTRYGVPGYLAAIVVVTAGYALFQTANNTGVMNGAGAGQRGAVSGLLNLSRNLGLISGAALIGAVYAFAAAATDVSVARPAAAANGMRASFAVAALLAFVALAIALAAQRRRSSPPAG